MKIAQTALSNLGPGADIGIADGTNKPKPLDKILKSKRTPKLEKLYGKLIKVGLVKIVRERGKPPRVVWVTAKR